MLKNLEQAIDKLQLGNAGPPGSKGIVISYSTGAEIKVPMGDLKAITGDALGSQKDYQQQDRHRRWCRASRSRSPSCRRSTTPRKALIVVGDGNDTNNETAKAAARAAQEAGRARRTIQTFAIIYKGGRLERRQRDHDDDSRRRRRSNSVEGIASELNAIIARMADRYYLTFPGYDDEDEDGPAVGRQGRTTSSLKIDQDRVPSRSRCSSRRSGARRRRAASRGSS